MAFVKPQINHIKTDMKNLTIYLRTIKKWGKSTLFRDVVLEKYGDASYGLSVGCGKEKGEKLLDNLNVTRINSYKDAIELKQWLIETKGKEHNIQIISFDTVDELIPIFEKETIRQSNIDNPTKKCKTINAAMGGFQEGQRFTAEMIKDYMDELTEAGFGVWGIAHTKFKNIKEKGGLEEDGYMQLTSNLVSAYESAFGDIFDVTLTGVIDRDIEEREVEIGEKKKTKRYATDSIRKLYFRGTPLIDAGGRFSDGAVPEYLVFDKPNMAKDFISTLEDGMEKSKTLKGKKSTVKSQIIEKIEPSVSEAITSEDDNLVEDTPLVEQVRELFKNCTDKDVKNEVRKIVRAYGKFDDVPDDVLSELHTKMS